MKSAFLHSVEEVLQELRELGFFCDCSALLNDSRMVGPQDVFIAVPGKRTDPRDLADPLLERGRCGVVLVEYDAERTYESARVLPVENLAALQAELAARYYNHPSRSMKVLAVTGTNGKTTVTRWLAKR
ncbi:MAG: hypothetical protein HC848_08935 [Limnobacter sp.]|nr:hypothetical protein [Limnobacter sp.]